jgi:hypothetical protein
MWYSIVLPSSKVLDHKIDTNSGGANRRKSGLNYTEGYSRFNDG